MGPAASAGRSRTALAGVIVLLALLALLAAARPAAAADVVVPAPGGARIVVQRDPVRVSFVDPSGRTVLRQTAAAGTSALVPPTVEQQFGTLSPPPSALYAPFTFLVGTHQVQQTPAG